MNSTGKNCLYNDTEFLSAKQVGCYLGVSQRKAGEIMHEMNCLILPGGRKRVSRQELETWVNHHTVSCGQKTGHIKPRESTLKTEYRIKRRTA